MQVETLKERLFMSKKKRIKFPMEFTVITYGTERKKVLKHGDTVRCLRCGQKIHIDGNSVIMVPGSVEDVPCVVCNNVIERDNYDVKHRCGYLAYVLYYIEQQEQDKAKKGRKVAEHGLL